MSAHSMNKGRLGAWAAGTMVLAFLTLFLVLPIASVFATAFTGDLSLTLDHFSAFFSQTLMRESFINSLVVAALATLLAVVLATPLAYLMVRYRLRGAQLVQTLGALPLLMPPFVGAVAMQLILGRSGSLNLLLSAHFGFTLPLMDNLNGVILVEAVHYFPFILLNLSLALRNIDGAMEQAAMSFGCRGWRLFWRVICPLGMPGLVAGASLVFVKVFDDLGTPLVLGVTNMLAPQAYLRITQVGIEDPMGYVISVIMVLFSIAAMWLASHAVRGSEHAGSKRTDSIERRKLGAFGSGVAYAWIAFVLLLTLSPYFGILLLSFGSVWSYTPLPDDFTLQHYRTMFHDAGGMINNTLLYCGLAAGIDVLLGMTIAYLIYRTKTRGRRWLESIATGALAIPGLVLAIGYLRCFEGAIDVGPNALVMSTWVMIMIAYAVRSLPYALRLCMTALEQMNISLEEAARSLGATRLRTLQRVVVPLMSGGILAAFVTSFITAAVDLSATLMLSPSQSQAPMSYGTYLYMQSVAGNGPGGALGVLSIVVVGVGIYLSHMIVSRMKVSQTMYRADEPEPRRLDVALHITSPSTTPQ